MTQPTIIHVLITVCYPKSQSYITCLIQHSFERCLISHQCHSVAASHQCHTDITPTSHQHHTNVTPMSHQRHTNVPQLFLVLSMSAISFMPLGIVIHAPPSATIVSPDMSEPASLATNNTMLAISTFVPTRPRGIWWSFKQSPPAKKTNSAVKSDRIMITM